MTTSDWPVVQYNRHAIEWQLCQQKIYACQSQLMACTKTEIFLKHSIKWAVSDDDSGKEEPKQHSCLSGFSSSVENVTALISEGNLFAKQDVALTP